VVLESATASRQHAWIGYQTSAGAVAVQDLRSGHGTYVNGEKIANGEPPIALREGETLRFGEETGAFFRLQRIDADGAVIDSLVKCTMPSEEQILRKENTVQESQEVKCDEFGRVIRADHDNREVKSEEHKRESQNDKRRDERRDERRDDKRPMTWQSSEEQGKKMRFTSEPAPSFKMNKDQKKKLIWGAKKVEEKPGNDNMWAASATQLGNQAKQSKFLRLMGAKSAPKASTEAGNMPGSSQNQLFNNLEQTFVQGRARLGGGRRGLG